MARDEAERSASPSPDRLSIAGVPPAELASRVWGEGSEAHHPEVASLREHRSGEPEPTRARSAPPNGRGRAEAILDAQARDIRELREAIEALFAAVDGVRGDLRELATSNTAAPRDRSAPRGSEEVDALEQRLDALERAVRTSIPRAMARAVDRALDRRLAHLVEQVVANRD